MVEAYRKIGLTHTEHIQVGQGLVRGASPIVDLIEIGTTLKGPDNSANGVRRFVVVPPRDFIGPSDHAKVFQRTESTIADALVKTAQWVGYTRRHPGSPTEGFYPVHEFNPDDITSVTTGIDKKQGSRVNGRFVGTIELNGTDVILGAIDLNEGVATELVFSH